MLVPYCASCNCPLSHSEKNIMFRDYIKRLESHKKCQSLSFTSFLLLPMQRITRLPLLILAILNRTPSDNPNHSMVEKTLRSVQSVSLWCLEIINHLASHFMHVYIYIPYCTCTCTVYVLNSSVTV